MILIYVQNTDVIEEDIHIYPCVPRRRAPGRPLHQSRAYSKLPLVGEGPCPGQAAEHEDDESSARGSLRPHFVTHIFLAHVSYPGIRYRHMIALSSRTVPLEQNIQTESTDMRGRCLPTTTRCVSMPRRMRVQPWMASFTLTGMLRARDV